MISAKEWSEVLTSLALGDAIGNPLEFIVPTKKDFEASINAPVLKVSDDTQMALFLAEALLEGAPLEQAYIRWGATQGIPVNTGLIKEGLLQFSELYSVQAPGMTCISSVRKLIEGGKPINDSKGNGTVMRCASVALFSSGRHHLSDAIELAKKDARVTHLHPLAAEASGEMVAIMYYLLKGFDLSDILLDLSSLLPIATNRSMYVRCLGKNSGWVAEEALCLAVNLCRDYHEEGWLAVIEKATCFPGDSDTVGAIAGAILGAMKVPIPNLAFKLNCIHPINYIETIVHAT